MKIISYTIPGSFFIRFKTKPIIVRLFIVANILMNSKIQAWLYFTSGIMFKS